MVSRVLTGKYQNPYSEYENYSYCQLIAQITDQNLRPTIPKNCNPEFSELIQLCWNSLPSQRPSCNIILEKLKNIEEKMIL